MTKKVLHKLTEVLLRPFREHFVFLVIFYLLTTGYYVVRQFDLNTMHTNLAAVILVMMHCFVLTYFLTLLIGLIRSTIIRRIIQIILLTIATLDFGINFYCLFHLKYFLDADLLQLILGTDINEAKEFASAMVPTWIVLSLSILLLLLIGLGWLSCKHNLNLGKKASLIALVLTAIALALHLYVMQIWKDGPINRFSELLEYDMPNQLNAYYSHPNISFNNQQQDMPANVVLIIGESFARSHSSLYDYDKPTNPCLSELRDNSLLFAFDSINSPAPTTAESIQYMLSTYSHRDDNNTSKKWYEFASIIEALQECGYECSWFGNQARRSIKNGTARLYAEACNRQFFLQQEGSDSFNDRYDNVLIDSSFQYINQPNQQHSHRFIIYHMMGSHFDFKMRYPSEYNHFKEDDYALEPIGHRTILATYDNSILYNDYIVSQIMNLFHDKDAVVIYVPDHGQVMYRNQNRPDYYAHGFSKDPISYVLGVEIPLIIYASPVFQKQHPDLMLLINSRQEHPKTWNSDDLPYLILDLIGAKTINGEDIHPKSLLN